MQAELPKEITKLIGKISFEDSSPILVQKGLWQNFCSAIEDSNPIYWNESDAIKHANELIAHPALLPSWTHDFEWHPNRKKVLPMQLHFHLKIDHTVEMPFEKVLHLKQKPVSDFQ